MKYLQATVSVTLHRILLLATAIAACSAITETSSSASDTVALHKLFGESALASNVWNVRERAANLPDDEAYQYLSEWVLPERLTKRCDLRVHLRQPIPLRSLNIRLQVAVKWWHRLMTLLMRQRDSVD